MIVYYSADSQFNLTDEEFKKALPAFNSGKNVWVERLGVHLSPFYKWAGKKPEDNNRRVLSDGSVAINKFGTWVDEKDENVKYNLMHYPELAKDLNNDDIKQLNEGRN